MSDDPHEDAMEEGDQRFTFVFLDVTYTVPVFGTDRLYVKGPWPKGRSTFGRRKKEGAGTFVRRVRLDASKAEQDGVAAANLPASSFVSPSASPASQ